MSSHRSSVWIKCRECGHTTRALTVMAKRVLSERNGCPSCQSQAAPILQPTSSGANISLLQWQLGMSEWERTAMSRGTDPSQIAEHPFQDSWGRKAIRHIAALSSQRMLQPKAYSNKGD